MSQAATPNIAVTGIFDRSADAMLALARAKHQALNELRMNVSGCVGAIKAARDFASQDGNSQRTLDALDGVMRTLKSEIEWSRAPALNGGYLLEIEGDERHDN